jgi:hypothetical protein
MRRDLESEGLMSADFVSRPDRLGSVREMGSGRGAEAFVGDHLNEYKNQWVESLTLKPLDPGTGKLETVEGGTRLSVQLSAPEVLVIVIR